MDLVVRDLVAGSVAGVATIVIMTPLDTARTRLQVAGDRNQSGWQVLAQIRREEGFRALYKGMMAPLCAQAAYKMVMFTTFGYLSRALQNHNLSASSPPIGFVCGAIAGGVNSFVVTPVELIRNRLAVQKGMTNLELRGPTQVIAKVVKTHGITGMFRGLGSTLARDVPGVGAYFSVFHFVRAQLQRVVESGQLPGALHIPLSGACAGVAFWTVALPFDAMKTLVQTREMRWRDAFGSVSWKQVYRTGYSMALARGIPGSSITFTVQNWASRQIDDILQNRKRPHLV